MKTDRFTASKHIFDQIHSFMASKLRTYRFIASELLSLERQKKKTIT
jgi:hypothetical protein